MCKMRFACMVKNSLKSSNSIKIFVKKRICKTYDLKVDPDENISSIKQKLLERYNIPVAQQRLTYHGEPLEDDRKITSYNIKNKSTLRLKLSGSNDEKYEVYTDDEQGTIYIDDEQGTINDPIPLFGCGYDDWYDVASPVHRPRSGPIPVDAFEAHFQRLNSDGKYRFSEEYKMIRNGPNCRAEHSAHPLNQPKNRDTNIVAYDHTRVLLNRCNNIPEEDYINANFIDGYKRDAAYIAAQDPLENTCEDFWRMVWEQNVPIIVMLTRCEEDGKTKCYPYWPEAGSTIHGTMQVTITESVEFPDYAVRLFSLLNGREPGQEKFVKHFHFLAWPDHGVPASETMLAFIRRVNSYTPPGGGPSLVHSSAGVGRTGTYIVLDVNLKRIDTEQKIEIYNYLQHIRTQRNLLVQTEGQYIFVHEALREYIRCGVTEIIAKELRDYTRKLQTQVPGSQELGVDREFNRLNEFAQQADHTFRAALAWANKAKNRFFSILPYDATRVCLQPIPGLQGSDYINANFIDGYFQPSAFIATQAPLRDTLADFWRMIWEHDCVTIVCLIVERDNTKLFTLSGGKNYILLTVK